MTINSAELTEIVFGPHLITLSGRRGDPYFDGIGHWEGSNKFVRYMLSRHFQRDFVCLDVGANIGLTACLMAAAAPSGRVYAFEPSPSAFPYLQKSINLTGLQNIEVVQMAIAAGPGELGFADNHDSAAASHLAKGSLSAETGKVLVTSVDYFVADKCLPRLDFVKIDVEGHEMDVLKGAQETLDRFNPFVLLEFNSFTLIAYGNENPRAVAERIINMFPFVYCLRDNKPTQLYGDDSILAFIHQNLILNGCVDDLVCSFKPIY